MSTCCSPNCVETNRGRFQIESHCVRRHDRITLPPDKCDVSTKSSLSKSRPDKLSLTLQPTRATVALRIALDGMSFYRPYKSMKICEMVCTPEPRRFSVVVLLFQILILITAPRQLTAAATLPTGFAEQPVASG